MICPGQLRDAGVGRCRGIGESGIVIEANVPGPSRAG
jgi:hypothetical protein